MFFIMAGDKAKLKCAKCSNIILDDGIKCGLFCGNSFHKICASVPELFHGELGKPNSNIAYHCSECSKFPIRQLFTKVNDLVSVVDMLSKKMCDFDSLQLNVSDLLNVVRNSSNYCCASDVHTGKTKSKHSNCVITDNSFASTSKSLRPQPNTPIITNTKGALNSSLHDSDTVCPVPVNTAVCGVTDIPNTSSNENEPNWQVAQNKRRKHRTHIIGADTLPDDLNVIARINWLHVSKFSTSTSENAIIKYVSTKLNINDNEVLCFKLIKKGMDISRLKYINFKVGVPAYKFNSALNANSWPLNVYVRNFDSLSKNVGPTHTNIKS